MYPLLIFYTNQNKIKIKLQNYKKWVFDHAAQTDQHFNPYKIIHSETLFSLYLNPNEFEIESFTERDPSSSLALVITFSRSDSVPDP